MACAYEQIKHLIRNDIVGKVERIAPVFEAGMKSVAENHPCIKVSVGKWKDLGYAFTEPLHSNTEALDFLVALMS
jgi:hypothetical protein